MVAAARRELASAGVTKPPDVVIADAGYWHLEQINEITGDGIPVLIPPDSSRRANKPKRPGWDGGAYDFMRSVLSNELGGELYRQRAQLIEPALRRHQTQPRLHPVHQARQISRSDRMATGGHHPQPGQAPPALHHRGRLTRRHRFTSSRPAGDAIAGTLCATASRATSGQRGDVPAAPGADSARCFAVSYGFRVASGADVLM